MSAVLKPRAERPHSPGATAAPQPQAQRRLKVVHPPQSRGATIAFPQRRVRDRPLWLQLLIVGQRLSLAMATVTVTGALSAYALTVDSNRRLTAATATLGRLQDHQQQLTTANAVFKNHLAQTALTAVDNGTLQPKDVIFLEEAEVPMPPASTEPTSVQAAPLDQRFFPKGY